MSDYELLTVVLMILGIVVSILIAYINHTRPQHKKAKSAVDNVIKQAEIMGSNIEL